MSCVSLTSRGRGWGELPLPGPVLAGERRRTELARAGKAAGSKAVGPLGELKGGGC